MSKSVDLHGVYNRLLHEYGHQGWWPLVSHDGSNPTKTGSHRGYHPGDYAFPRNREEQFEIAVGAILTQNTAWTNVESALIRLHAEGILHDPEALLFCDDDRVKELIRPAGYFNQKCRYLKNIAEFFITERTTPRREQLLNISGIGEETADAILLYAFSVPSFVVDAYTRRFLIFYGIVPDATSYSRIQTLFHDSLPHSVDLFQEFHALFVEHGKRFYSKKPYGESLFTDSL